MDTANTAHAAEVAGWGILDGVTTNPTLVSKEGRDFKETIIEMCGIVDCVSAQITATDKDEMIAQGVKYASWHDNVVVKVPVTGDDGVWLSVLSHLSEKGIATNTTLIFSAAQAMMAAKAGASIISPFIGRLDDAGQDGMELIAEIMQIWSQYDFDTEVLVASTRHPRHIIDAAQMGAHICTIPYELFKKMTTHPLSTAGLEKFLADWEKAKK